MPAGPVICPKRRRRRQGREAPGRRRLAAVQKTVQKPSLSPTNRAGTRTEGGSGATGLLVLHPCQQRSPGLEEIPSRRLGSNLQWQRQQRGGCLSTAPTHSGRPRPPPACDAHREDGHRQEAAPTHRCHGQQQRGVGTQRWSGAGEWPLLGELSAGTLRRPECRGMRRVVVLAFLESAQQAQHRAGLPAGGGRGRLLARVWGVQRAAAVREKCWEVQGRAQRP